MKRFTETCRFDEEWYAELSPEMKCAYEFIWARADNSGVWSVNRKLAEFQIGKKINWDEFIKAVKGRVIPLNEREWLLCGFVEMQCGKLSLECRPHRVVIDLLQKRGLLTDSLSIDYPKGSLLPFNTITVKGTSGEEGAVLDPGEKRIPASPESKRIATMFGRRLTTPWSEKEIRAIKAVSPINPEDMDLVESYYKSGCEYLRKDLLTFLNNFNGEVDRARAWKENPPSSKQRFPGNGAPKLSCQGMPSIEDQINGSR